MNLITKKSIFVVMIFITGRLQAAPEQIISLFVKKYPYFKKSKNSNRMLQKLQQPNYITNKVIKKFTNAVEGIMFLYAGNIATSNRLGQVVFPCLQQSRNINILVTPQVTPAYTIAPATLQNWLVPENVATAWYEVTLKFDKDSQLYYHETTKSTLPQDRKIPLNTIILIASPEDIYIGEGGSIVNPSSSILLPDIFIRRSFCFVYNSLFNLAIKQYFDQTTQTEKQDGQTVIYLEQ